MAKAFRYALKHSLPILISYIPVALAYGVLMQNCGYNFVWTGACSIFVLAGSLQYLMVTFFAGGVSLLTVAIMSLLLNSRHIFFTEKGAVGFVTDYLRGNIFSSIP